MQWPLNICGGFLCPNVFTLGLRLQCVTTHIFMRGKVPCLYQIQQQGENRWNAVNVVTWRSSELITVTSNVFQVKVCQAFMLFLQLTPLQYRYILVNVSLLFCLCSTPFKCPYTTCMLPYFQQISAISLTSLFVSLTYYKAVRKMYKSLVVFIKKILLQKSSRL